MKKSKAENVDLLYVSDDNKNKMKKKRVVENKKTTTKKGAKKGQVNNNDLFNIDDEIIIGITKKDDERKDKPNKKKAKKNKKQKNKSLKSKTQNEKTEKKQRKALNIVKYSVLLLIIIGGIIYFMLSPVFNIKTITVNNNNKLSKEEIISLSGISTEENTFKIRTKQAESNIKQNSYIDSVKVSRKLPSEILIDVSERVPTFMLEFINGVVYINNQGYMLEITEERLDLPIISGLTTPLEDFGIGNRLCIEDLQKLETVLKIMDTANSYEIGKLITGINIADKNNYTLYLEKELKTVYLGNASNINTRIMYLKEILEREKGIESEVFLNKDINKDDVYTREKV